MSVLHKVTELIPPAERCQKLKLLVEWGTHDFSFLWYAGKGPEIHGLYMAYSENPLPPDAWREELDRIMGSHPAFKSAAASVHVFVNSDESALIPMAFYDKATSRAGFELMFGESFDTTFHEDEIKEMQMMVAYRYPSCIKEAIEKYFPDAGIQHVHAALICKENTRLELLSCSVHPGYIRVTLLSGQQLKFFRQYQYTAPEDVSYHLLNVCSRFSVSPEHIKLRLDGLLDKDSHLYRELHKYFGNMIFAGDPMVDLSHAEVLKSMHPHYYYKLIRLSACAS